MKREDIIALSDLARIELTEAELGRFSKEFDDILTYVDRVKGLAKDSQEAPSIGPVANVFREDENPHEPGIYTEDLLANVPVREGQYIKVKKILEK